ncbi:MAG: hypothetical protein JST11_18425 [Acidobacteria bacterium]|nr:hypothetical protein [Acidobacteriota bacterium]
MRRGQADATEIRRVDGQWMCESGASVEIGAVLPVMPVTWETARFARAVASRIGCRVEGLGSRMTN